VIHTDEEELQIHAALAEWQTGRRVPVDFASNRYHSIYVDHINSLKLIETEKLGGYKKMMRNLYNSSRSGISLCIR
jgi:hypothetical protein